MSATSASLLRSEWSPSTKKQGDRSRDGGRLTLELLRRGEGVAPTRDEEAGQPQLAEVLGAEAFGAARGMERVADQDERGHVQAAGGGHRAHPAPEGTTADGDAVGRDGQPPGQRRRWRPAPSRCTPPVGPCAACPAACPGNSTRSTATPARVTASSMATSPDCSRPALAPGVSTSPAIPAAAIGP